MLRRLGIEQRADVRCIGDHAGQAKELDRGVVGVDAHVDTGLLGHWNNLTEEVRQVLLHLRLREALVVVEGFLELVHGIDGLTHAPGEPTDNVVGEGLPLFIVHGIEGYLRLLELLGLVVYLGVWPLQNVQVEDSEVPAVEAQRDAAVAPFKVQVGPSPVHDRHEVVAQYVDAAGPHVADALLVRLDEPIAVRATVLDLLVHGDALDDGPRQAGVLDELFAFPESLH
mmetsp:Transcript_46891/g.118152  ORF Transcript_46891/g.118152 Transcript_46891/m.118152 type:complete len:227 (+) Transcript_46891:127-807(+)